jgi:hypothetical protein
MIENILSGLIGAVVGAVLSWVLARRMAKETIKAESKALIVDETRLDLAKKLTEYLSRVLNREAPESLKNNVPEIKREWAILNRQLYLLKAPEKEREQFDDRMVDYLKSLTELVTNSAHRPEVERQRAKAKQAALDFLLRIGVADVWVES